MFSTLHRTPPGETTFLETLDGDAQLAPSGGVAPGERQTVGTVSPKRGRLLLSLGCRLSIQQGVELYIYWFQDFCWCCCFFGTDAWFFLFFNFGGLRLKDEKVMLVLHLFVYTPACPSWQSLFHQTFQIPKTKESYIIKLYVFLCKGKPTPKIAWK